PLHARAERACTLPSTPQPDTGPTVPSVRRSSAALTCASCVSSSSSRPSSKVGQVLASLRKYRNYRLYFAGQIVSYSGSWMQDTALPWLVLERTHSPFHVGLLVFCRYGPFMVGGLYGGVIADRYDNRRVLICSQSLAMCVAAGLAAVAFLGTGGDLWLLYLLATGTGVALIFDNPSKHALIYQL